jgi:hypothetical protein
MQSSPELKNEREFKFKGSGESEKREVEINNTQKEA